MAVAFPSHATPGGQLQFAIDLRSQLVQSTFVAPMPCLKQLGDLVSESVIHPDPWAGEVADCVNITPPGSFKIRCPKKVYFPLQVLAAVSAIWSEVDRQAGRRRQPRPKSKGETDMKSTLCKMTALLGMLLACALLTVPAVAQWTLPCR